MKLKKIDIEYNDSNNISWTGVPANSYGGKITLSTKIGEVTTVLTEDDIATIVRVIAGRVAADMVTLSHAVTDDIRLSVEQKAIDVSENKDG